METYFPLVIVYFLLRISPSTTVSGGHKVSPGEAFWHVSVRRLDQHVCNGALAITDQGKQVVVTVATCLMRPHPSVEPYPAHTITVLAGRIHLNEYNQAEQLRHVFHVYLNEYIDRETFHNDLAVLILVEDFIVDDFVKPIKLPSPWKNKLTDNLLIMAGWGKKTNTKLPGELQLNGIPHYDWETCESKYYQYYRKKLVFWNSDCVGDAERSPCDLDEGSGLIARNVTSNEHYLFGIYQWKHGECPDWYWPGIMINIPREMRFIREASFGNFTRRAGRDE